MYHRRLHEQSLRVPVVQYGCTPLSWATQANSFAIAELLIEKGIGEYLRQAAYHSR